MKIESKEIQKSLSIVPIQRESLKELKEYLIYHEEDIAIGINDFAGLRGVFANIIGRVAIYAHDGNINEITARREKESAEFAIAQEECRKENIQSFFNILREV